MRKVIAIAVTDFELTRLGLPSRTDRAVLAQTVERLSRIEQVDDVVVVHPPGQSVQTTAPAVQAPVRDERTASIVSARKWALNAWRGGLGGATCYDELLPASAMLRAMQAHHADSAVIVGGDWMLVDPALCQRVLDLHLQDPDEYLMTFSQAPPGLCGIVAARELIEQLAEKQAGFGQILAYVPQRPQADPIGRDVCAQVSPQVRGCTRRFIYDTDRTCAMIDALGEQFGDALIDAGAEELCAAVPTPAEPGPPREFSLELTPQRSADGSLTPQHHVKIDREPIDVQAAKRIIAQVAAYDDAVITFGGLGDALQHPQWKQIIQAAHDAGVFGINIETDLHVEQDDLDYLLDAPIDVISVRLNADTAETYEKLMSDQPGRFKRVVDNVQYLLQQRARREQFGPWIVPHLIKTADTLKDMETFFERWMTFAGQAVIEPATTGCGLMPNFAPIDMAPPRRRPCRQLHHRLTIHADGRVPRCDQDWLAQAACGDATQTSIDELWHSQQPVRDAHEQGDFDQLELCSGCSEWHRP